MVTAVAPTSDRSTGTWPSACTASVWKGTPALRHAAAMSRTGWTVPTSLFAHMTETSAVRSAADDNN